MGTAGVLIDIDGVLTVSWEPLPGAIGAFERLRASGLRIRLATNTTSRTRAEVAAALRDAGFGVTPAEILTAPVATAGYLETHHRGQPVFVLSSGDLHDDFREVDVVDERAPAEVVVLGGAGLVYSHDQLNHAFNLILDGAAFVAMHRNLYWRTNRGMELDTGAYAMALEAATGVEPVVIGKPAAAFFEAALTELGTAADETVMIGDDLDNDVLGAQALGITGCLVRTGKYRADVLEGAENRPDHVVDTFVDAVQLCLTN